jgi:hypothetical protein
MKLRPFAIKDDPNQPDYFDFTRVKKRSGSFFHQDSLIYLVNMKADFVQEKLTNPDIKHSPNFNELLDSEITRIKMLMDIEKLDEELELIKEEKSKLRGAMIDTRLVREAKPRIIPTDKKSIKELKHKDLTVDRAVLFFEYLFNFANSDCSKADKARVISFFTNFDDEKLRQQLSGINKKAYSNFVNFEKDMNIVFGLFELLGLPEVAGLITHDLKRMEAETEEEL